MIKVSIQWKDITIINICGPHSREPKYIKQTLKELEEETEKKWTMIQ